MRRAAPMGALWMLSSLMELFSLRLCPWQRQCNPIRYWQTQCNHTTRQSECDSPLRGQSHSLCLITPEEIFLPPLARRRRIWYTTRTFRSNGVVAQLVSALDCRSGGCGFEPRRPRQSEKIGRLPRGVMVAPQILILLVGVRVPARQPTRRRRKNLGHKPGLFCYNQRSL